VVGQQRVRVAKPTLKGHHQDVAAPQPKARGWHPIDWACEGIGTFAQLFVGFGVVALLESPLSPVTSALPDWSRLVLIGIAFGLLAAGVATSPVGRRSGAHLNPSVSLGFFLRKHTQLRDLAGYVIAQVVGAIGAAYAFRAVWHQWASSVSGASTAPEVGLPGWGVVAIEAALTFGLLITVFSMVSSPRTARWTPTAVTGVLAGLIWAGAPHTGASMNPARTLGPDIATGSFPVIWAYFVGPLAGAVIAVLAFDLLSRRVTLTAKLFHDPDYPSVHATDLPAKPQRKSGQLPPARDTFLTSGHALSGFARLRIGNSATVRDGRRDAGQMSSSAAQSDERGGVRPDDSPAR
jgi:aquaporin Z